MSNTKRDNCIIYKSKNGDKFIVTNTRPGGQDMIFTATKYGLYYNNMSNIKGVSMLSTVEENLKYYTQQKYESAKIVRESFQMVGYHSIKDYKKIIKTNAIKIFQSQWKSLTYVRRYLVPINKH